MIELNTPYTQNALILELGVAKRTFISRREDYLFSLKLAYNFNISKSGNSIIYTFTEQFDEWERPTSKLKSEKNKTLIKEYIRKTIKEVPLQTAANINRLAWYYTEQSKIKDLGLKKSTTRRYVGECLKEMFGKKVNEHGDEGYISRKVWVRLDSAQNKYYPLEKQYIDEYLGYIQHGDEKIRELDAEAYSDYTNGLITREELRDIFDENCYNKFTIAMKCFKEKYGFMPLKVPEYMLGLFFTDDEIKNSDFIFGDE